MRINADEPGVSSIGFLTARICLAWLAAWLGVSTAQAQVTNGAWSATGGGNWWDATKWLGGKVASGAGASAYLTNAFTTRSTVTVNQDTTVGRLFIDDSQAITVATPSKLTLDNNGSDAVISVGNSDGNGAHAIAGFTFNGNLQVANQSSAGLTLSGAIVGSGNITYTGPQILKFSGSSPNFTGGLTISGGTVNLQNSGALGNGGIAGPLVLGSGSTLSMNAAIGLNVKGSYSDTASSIIQLGASTDVSNHGLHFANGLSSTFNGTVRGAAINDDDLIFGATGNNTIVSFQGTFDSDGNNQNNWIHVRNNARLEVGSSAILRSRTAVNNNHSLRFRGDGTGTIDFNAGFVADRAGTGDDLGHFFIENVNVVMRNSQNFPTTFVHFDTISGGKLSIQDNNQTLGAAQELRFRTSGTLETVANFTLSDLDIDASQTVTKSGAGVLTVSDGGSGDNVIGAGAAMNLTAGTLRYNAENKNTDRLAVTVGSSATLGGVGDLGNITVNAGGTLEPGASSGAFGILGVNNLTLASGGYYAVTLGGTVAGTSYDQTSVGGNTLNLGGATLQVTVSASLTIGNQFRIIDWTAGGTLGTQFAQGTSLTTTYGSDYYGFGINYSGGTGNDVVLTLNSITPIPEPATWALLGLGMLALGLRRRSR